MMVIDYYNTSCKKSRLYKVVNKVTYHLVHCDHIVTRDSINGGMVEIVGFHLAMFIAMLSYLMPYSWNLS